ncbi:hypothetical protein N7453_003484 [Penicillium expansum]|nr:hypothetical protein N7453_003484 [Penicillium expansum]
MDALLQIAPVSATTTKPKKERKGVEWKPSGRTSFHLALPSTAPAERLQPDIQPRGLASPTLRDME